MMNKPHSKIEWGLFCISSRFLQIQGVLFVVLDLVINLQSVTGSFQDENTVIGVLVHRHRPPKAQFRFHTSPSASLNDIGISVEFRNSKTQ